MKSSFIKLMVKKKKLSQELDISIGGCVYVARVEDITLDLYIDNSVHSLLCYHNIYYSSFSFHFQQALEKRLRNGEVKYRDRREKFFY